MDLHLTKEAGRLGTVPRGMRLCSTATARGARLNGIRLRGCDLVKAKRWLPRSVALLLELSIPPTLHTTHPATAEHHCGAPVVGARGARGKNAPSARIGRYAIYFFLCSSALPFKVTSGLTIFSYLFLLF